MNNNRFPLPVDHSRSPFVFTRTRVMLVIAIFYVCGFFTGAIVFGEALLTLHTP
jgi:hypothetical protein